MVIKKRGCEDLTYEFRFNEAENRIEFEASFRSEDGGLMIPWSTLQTYGRRKHGNVAVDTLFDHPDKMRQVVRKAETLFTEEIGSAISVAIQMLSQDVAQRVGLLPKVTSGKWGELLATVWKNERSKALKIKTGPKEGSTWSWGNHPKPTNKEFTARLDAEIDRISADGDYPKCKLVAQVMGFGSARTLTRYRQNHDLKGNAPWRIRIKHTRGK